MRAIDLEVSSNTIEAIIPSAQGRMVSNKEKGMKIAVFIPFWL